MLLSFYCQNLQLIKEFNHRLKVLTTKVCRDATQVIFNEKQRHSNIVRRQEVKAYKIYTYCRVIYI